MDSNYLLGYVCDIQLPKVWPLTYWPAMVEPSAEMLTASVKVVPAGILKSLAGSSDGVALG
jgi:hypothetical protein